MFSPSTSLYLWRCAKESSDKVHRVTRQPKGGAVSVPRLPPTFAFIQFDLVLGHCARKRRAYGIFEGLLSHWLKSAEINSVGFLTVFSLIGSPQQPGFTSKTPTCPWLEAACEEYSGDVSWAGGRCWWDLGCPYSDKVFNGLWRAFCVSRHHFRRKCLLGCQ